MPPAKPKPVSPNQLRSGGRALWDSVLERESKMTEPRKRVLLEACRLADQLDRINPELDDDRDALSIAKNLGDQMTKHLATLRVLAAPDGKSQSYQGGSQPGVSRGAYSKDGNVSSLDEARKSS